MRYGVLADVHGNLHALDAALEALAGERVDAYLCAGDLVGYGAFPNECVEAVARLSALCVAGNHDLIALGRLSDERCIPLARESLRWTRDVLDEPARAYLSALPLRVETADGVVVSHGSFDDPEEYTRTPEQAARQLDRLAAEHPSACVLVLGHTHRPWAWEARRGVLDVRRPVSLPPASLCLLNPGGLGQSRERRARARFLVLDLERRQATFHAVPYDVEGCRKALRRHGLRADSYHLRRRGLAAVPRPVRRLVRLSAALLHADRLVEKP